MPTTFRFRMATLLRLREAARDERRGQLTEAQRAAQVILDRLAELDGELAALRRQSVAAARPGTLNVDQLLDTSRYEMILKLERQSADQQRQAVAAEVQKRRAALVAADREVRVLEKLRDTQHGRHREEQNRKETKLLDEMAVLRFERTEALVMARLTGTIGSLLAYLCIGTIIAQAIVVGYAWMHGYLDKEKIGRIAEVARGAELASATAAPAAKTVESSEQPSFDEIERLRGIKARHLELREQSVENGLERIRFEKDKLTTERANYELLKAHIEKVLKDKGDEAQNSGRENVQLVWENIKPKLVKEQILRMIDAGELNDVVSILSSIAIAKRAKIISEFKTDEETKKMDEILRLIRQGVPDVIPIQQAEEELKKFSPKQP